MELGYIHPDVMLRQMTAAQATGWLAYACLEPVGNPVDIKTEADQVAARRCMRDEFESGMRALKARRN